MSLNEQSSPQPAQWNYSIDAAGNAQASYPGDVFIGGQLVPLNFIGQTVRTAESFGAVGDGVTGNRAAFRLISQWLSPALNGGIGNRTVIFSGVYRIERASAPFFTGNFLTEGALYIQNPNNTGIYGYPGATILMDNLNPSTGDGDQDHCFFACSLGAQSSGLFIDGQMSFGWKTVANARSQGDAIHIQGYPSTNTLGTNNNGLISDIRIGKTFSFNAPQVGSIICGCANVDWTSHESNGTLADCWHSNACQNVQIGQIKGLNCGDDTCAFVTYYSTTSVDGPVPGFSPYYQPSLGAFSNYNCVVGQVLSYNSLTDGLRLAGAYQVSVDLVLAYSGIHAFVQDAGLAGGPDAWSYQQSMGCFVGFIGAYGCAEAAYFNAFNVTIAGNPSSFWKTDTLIGHIESRSVTNWCIEVDSVVGLRFGFVDSDGGGGAGGGLSLNGFQDITFGDVKLANSASTTSLNGYTNGVTFGSLRPTTGLKMGNVWTEGVQFQLVDITGLSFASFRSNNSVLSGLIMTTCSDIVAGPIQVQNFNRGAGTAYGVLLDPIQRAQFSSILITQDDTAITASIEIGGGTGTYVAQDIHISWFHVNTNLAPANPTDYVSIQGGADAPVNYQLRGTYRNSDGVLHASDYGFSFITTVAALPGTTANGMTVAGGPRRFMVTDATTTTFGAAVVGGGSNPVPVYRDPSGTWRIG